jgi:glycosyltransferase involved in cell wall biosynthesis
MGAQAVRVCHLAKYYPPASGGIETHVRTLAQSQAGLGADITVICVNHRDSAGQDTSWQSWCGTPYAEHTDGPVRVIRVGRRFSLAKYDYCIGLQGAIRNLMPVDIIHLHTPNPTMLFELARDRPFSNFIITHHSDVVRQCILKHLFRPFEYSVYSKAARIFATSPLYQAGSTILQKYADRVQCLPLGLNLQPYLQPAPSALAHTELLQKKIAGPLWLTVGRFVYYKGLEIAIRALVEVSGTLVIVGPGPNRTDLIRLAEKLGVQNRIIWWGHATPDELVGAYHAATALWFPSNARSEAFGLVQVEAMASGCPVINTAIPDSGVPWVSRHNESGLTVPMNDHEALANAAKRLACDHALRDQLSAGARKRSSTEFDHRIMARRSLEIYHQVIAEQSQPRTAPFEVNPEPAEMELETV